MVKRLVKKIRMENTHHSLIDDGVPEHEQTLKLGKPFWVLFGGNMGLATWLMGVLVAGMGLDFTNGVIVIMLGAVVGSVLPALTSIVGPRSRLSQMEAGRFALGRAGKKLPAFLNWVSAIGWDVVNNVISGAALALMMSEFGFPIPLWVAFAILVSLQMLVGIYGHHLIQDVSKYTGPILGGSFVIIGIIAMHQSGPALTLAKTVPWKAILSAFVLLVAYNIGWTTFTADYTRYLPKNTPSRLVFLQIFWSLFLSLAILGFFGFATASVVTDQTPEGVMKAIQGLTGHFAPLALFLIAFSSIPVNAINDNSAAYSIISTGFKFSRPTSAIFGALLGYFVCLAASSSFVEFFENFLLLFAHWLTPWAAVILVHWFTVGKHEQKTSSGLTVGTLVFCGISIASLALFAANPLYTGPLADKMSGVDIGPYVGFFVAGSLYWVILRFSNKKAYI